MEEWRRSEIMTEEMRMEEEARDREDEERDKAFREEWRLRDIEDEKERERVNQRPKTVAGREYLETIKIKQREKSYDISCGNATIQKKWSKKIVVNAKDVLEDNRGWSNKTDAHEKR